MTCKETRTYMDGYLDRELDLVRSIDLERHLHDCLACAELHKARMAVRGGMGSLSYKAPAALRKSLLTKLEEAEAAEKKTGPREMPPGIVPRSTWIYAGAAVAAAVVVAVLIRPAPEDAQRQVVDSHIRSLMPGHLTDVVSTDQHTVKPWFAGHADFSPQVADFASQGFPLIGGRMDYFGDHPAAVVVYQRNKHVINVFSWRSRTAYSERTATDHGYHIVRFARDGIEYWIVSDLNLGELKQFAGLLS